MTPGIDEQGQARLTRERLVHASLALIQEDGLDGLSMRGLAERLDVKAASLYWHVRDRKELLELLAASLLDSVPKPRGAGDWRSVVTATTAALHERVKSQVDAARILLAAPEALVQSEPFRDIRAQLVTAGLDVGEAGDVAAMVMTYAIGGGMPAATTAPANPASGGPAAELAVDSGSRGVRIRAGSADMEALVRVPPERSSAAPAVVRGERVIVRRLRGVGRGELELNPRRPWAFHVQAPTWNTLLDLGGLEVTRIHVDSGAAKLEVFLPVPAGVVPIHISSGVVQVALHRPSGTAAVADLSTGAVQVRLDDFSTRATAFDTHWQSENAAGAADRFELRISSGAVRVTLDSYELKPAEPSPAEPSRGGAAGTNALEILLDGVEARIARRRQPGG